MTDIFGAVLAGGRSARFGSDKALAEAGGKPLIEHAIDALAAVTGQVTICGRQLAGYTCLPDRPAAGLGPLAGLNAALHHAHALRRPWVLSIACDTPVLPQGLLQSLADGRRPQYVEGLPVIGLWPSCVASQLDDWLATSRSRSMRDWAVSLNAEGVFEGVDILNFNYAHELDRWLAEAPGRRP